MAKPDWTVKNRFRKGGRRRRLSRKWLFHAAEMTYILYLLHWWWVCWQKILYGSAPVLIIKQRLKTGSNVHPPTCEIHLTSIADQVLRKLTFFRNNNKVTLQEIKDNSLISDFHFPSFCFLFRRALPSTMREMHEEKSNSVNETSGLLRCFWKAHLTNYFESGFRMSIH